MTFDLGDAVALSATARDAAGTPANATSAVLTITLPDGTTVSPEVTNPPTTVGVYEVSYTPTVAGLHGVRWLFTGPDSATSDVFNVRPSTPRMLVSLADARGFLKKKSDVDDEELRRVIEATTTKIEERTGPVVRATHTEHHRGGRSAIALAQRPVLEVTSVTRVRDDGVAVDPALLEVDAKSGVVWLRSGLDLPCEDLRVTYTAGRPVVDAAILEAAAIIIDHLWQNRRGHSARPGMFGQQPEQPATEEQAIAYYAGFALPHRAAELLAPFDQSDGFA